MSAERDRLLEVPKGRSPWRHWGPYLSERAWGTVREDYSAGGDAWDFFPHEHARSRAYRWNEDGLAGICDDRQTLCFALAVWNRRDPILKERIFGLTGTEGNHGEDAKEYWFYLDSTPTHSWMGGFERLSQQELGEAFCGFVEPEAFAGSVVEFVGDVVEVEFGVDAEVGALGEVLA
jgi:hypothetical protein